MEQSLKSKSLKGTVWSLIDTSCSRGIDFVFGIIMARLLLPADYGMVGVLAVFLSLSNVFIDCGFSRALIRKKDRTAEDLSTAFYFNLGVSLVCYLLLFLLAPLIARFFEMSMLASLLRVMAICLLLNSLSIVQNALLTAKLEIKAQTFIHVMTQLPMGIVGVFLAYRGYGPWALVVQQVGSNLLNAIWLWSYSRWHPGWVFCKESFHYLYQFGWKLLCTNLIGTFFEEMYSFVIGRVLGASALGYYTKSLHFSSVPRTFLAGVINRVALPVMVEMQGSIEKTKKAYRKLIAILSLVTFPVYGLLMLLAKPVILLLWTEKWAEAIVLLQIFCVGMSFAPFSALNTCLLQLMNRTDMVLKLEYVKRSIGVVLLLVSIPFGLKGIVWFLSVYYVIANLIHLYPTHKLLDYSFLEQLGDILPSLAITLLTMGVSVIPLFFMESRIATILLVGLLFGLVYIALSVIGNRKVILEVKKLIL